MKKANAALLIILAAAAFVATHCQGSLGRLVKAAPAAIAALLAVDMTHGIEHQQKIRGIL